MHIIKKYFRSSVLTIVCFAACLVPAQGMMDAGAFAAELPEGTIITKDNLDKIKNDTFQGKTIISMLTDEVQMMIRDWGLKIKISKTNRFDKYDPRYWEATKKYSGNIKYDAATREITGYTAGWPFPDVDENDPEAGSKLMLNFYYSPLAGNIQYSPHAWLLIDADAGLERVQHWYWLRYYMKGRVDPNKPPTEDDKILTKTLFFITYPFDLKGVGLFTIRWDSPKYEDTWIYVKSVRRTRRMSGGSWIDPVGSLDMLNDDIYVMNARPSWYKSIKLVGKKTIFVMANEPIMWDESKKGTNAEFPGVDLDNYPHFWPSLNRTFEPRECYVIEAIPPERHPYSKRIVYMDVEKPVVLWQGECYDKKGDFWKYIVYSYGPKIGEDGYYIQVAGQGIYADLKRRHGSAHTLFDYVINQPNVGPDDVTLGQLRAASK